MDPRVGLQELGTRTSRRAPTDLADRWAIVEGENLEVDPPRRLVQSFRALWSEEVKRAGTSRVTWEIEPVGTHAGCRVTHDQLATAPTRSSTAAGQ